MKTKLKSIILVLFCTIFTVSGQIFWKFGSEKLTLNFIAIITNLPLFAGFLCYAIAAVLLISALKYGELSLVYPFIATSFVWVSLLAPNIFGEEIHSLRWIAITIIVIGVALVGSSGSNKK